MRKIPKICVFTILLTLSVGLGVQQVRAVEPAYYESMGYVCTMISSSWWGSDKYTCTKTTYTQSAPTYDAIKHDYRTLEGTAKTTTIAHTDTKDAYMTSIDESPNGKGDPGEGCPFIYLYNAPEGNISVSLDSQLDTYYPQPNFNQKNGWLVNAQGSDISLGGEKEDALFYELELKKITLNRNGKNFSSKEELVNYLEDSDFLTKLGFSDTEKTNSLNYILPKIEQEDHTNYYYLTILSDEAIAEISDIAVEPVPTQIVRQYFAVYPTDVPIKTMDDFHFPENTQTHTDNFVVKETGEFLIQKAIHVFFE